MSITATTTHVLSTESPEAKHIAMSDGGSDEDAGDDYARIGGDDYLPPKEEPEWQFGSGDGEADDDYDPLDVDDYCDYDSLKEDPESKVMDVDYHILKEEPKPELDDGDGDAVDVNGYCDYDPPKREPEPELLATSDGTGTDGGRDVDYDCSHCGINLSTPEFKVKHELRCKAQIQRRELESQVTEVHPCIYCRCPFLNEEFKKQHQRKWCRKRPITKTADDFNGPYFRCDECEYVAKYKSHFESHLLKHNKNDAEWFTCMQCSYKTVRKHCMSRHIKIHGNTFSCCCPVCQKSFRTKRGLDDHLVRQHSDEWDEVSTLITNKIYTCNICDQFRTIVKSCYNEHLTITHNKGVGCKKYECPRCPYSTFSKGSLTKHSKRHAEQKEYQCAVCKKQFAKKQELDSHVLYIHADNVDLVKTITSKIHSCELCSFKSVGSGDLKRHVRSKHS